MKIKTLSFCFIFFSASLFSQNPKTLYPMNWVGINFSKTLGTNNQIVDFEIKRKLLKKNNVEINLTGNFEFSFTTIHKDLEFNEPNKKHGLTLEVNYIFSHQYYCGIGLQVERYSKFEETKLAPRIAGGIVLSKKHHILLELFFERNKLNEAESPTNPIWTYHQIFENMDQKISLGVGLKKSIFFPKKKWVKNERWGGSNYIL